MSNLPGNPYARSIEQLDAEVGDREFSPNVAHALMQSKLVSATLALAYEQRTANLIAVAKWTNGLDVASNLMGQVAERMGLKEWE